jgi:hypothetical protein
MLILAVLAFSSPQSVSANELEWGKDVGYISGKVSAADDAKGLAVRSDASQTAKVLTYLKPGAQIRGKNVFQDGWVNVKSPVQDGWAPLSFLQPDPFEGAVTKVDQRDLCLPLRRGPGDSYEQIDCAQIGEVLKFSGVATRDNWLQLTDRKGWAPASHISLEAWTALTEKDEAQAAPSFAETASSKNTLTISAPAHEIVPGFPAHPPDEEDEGESPDAEICSDKWCVDFARSKITHDGKPESFVTCARDEICAMIMAEFWAALLEDDEHVDIPISSAMSVRVARDGAIRNPESGVMLKKCGGASGLDVECVVAFLLDISQPLAVDAGTATTGPGDPDKAAEVSPDSQARGKTTPSEWPQKQPATAASAKQSESAKPDEHSAKERVTRESKPKKSQTRQTRSREEPEFEAVSPSEMFADPFFDQNAAQEKRLEESWEDAQRRRFSR